MRLAELAERIGGVLEGDGDTEIHGLSGLADAGAGDLSFLANQKYASLLSDTKAAALVVGERWEQRVKCPLIRVPNPDKAMALAAEILGPPVRPELEIGVHPSAVVSEDVSVAPDARIGPCCVIESGAVIDSGAVLVAGCYVGTGSVIGADSLLRANVVIRDGVRLGKRVVIHEGAVLGSDGFGNYREGGRWIKIPHIGKVEVGDDVEVGANATIDRARFGLTVIKEGARIDNLVQIGHNVQVGAHTAMAAQVGIAGSTVIGEGVTMGGQAGVTGHVTIGDGAVVGAQAGVSKSVPGGLLVAGTPAMAHRKLAESHANLKRLDAWKEKVKRLEARLDELEKKIPVE